ncbi:hypothetical protein BT96DRAFT_1010546 [Gymnopus androsaceus JB14]|uniref:Uncharacterized protein n=1 Tax=Gymnopus androsaceus JB14 TaxID=1447944 RepID=A0A6A4GAI9_9AGAR|nr:hypothetical protein BT96DRAFT_1010546 [Gymnopus androsaceus JB14]
MPPLNGSIEGNTIADNLWATGAKLKVAWRMDNVVNGASDASEFMRNPYPVATTARFSHYSQGRPLSYPSLNRLFLYLSLSNSSKSPRSTHECIVVALLTHVRYLSPDVGAKLLLRRGGCLSLGESQPVTLVLLCPEQTSPPPSPPSTDTQPYYNTGPEYGNAPFPAKSYPPETWMFQIGAPEEVEELAGAPLVQAILERTGDPVDVKFRIRGFAQMTVRGGYRVFVQWELADSQVPRTTGPSGGNSESSGGIDMDQEVLSLHRPSSPSSTRQDPMLPLTYLKGLLSLGVIKAAASRHPSSPSSSIIIGPCDSDSSYSSLTASSRLPDLQLRVWMQIQPPSKRQAT